MSNNIEGKVVVITGASSGLGESTARHLATLGATVVLGARRKDRLNAIVKDIEAAGGKAHNGPRSNHWSTEPSTRMARSTSL